MNSMPMYVVITPVRDEVDHIGNTIASMIAQTVMPAQWIIVDDGSTDGTADIVDRMAKDYGWITPLHRVNRGFRKSGGGVIEAFLEGYRAIRIGNFEYIVKLDGDLSFAPDYFERCFEHFDKEPTLGIGGGLVYQQGRTGLERDSKGDPWFHVRGATKIYRRACWNSIEPLFTAPGWDTIDELKANMLGWTTHSFNELKLIQLKDTGAGDGSWRNAVKNGRANYITGYHPFFMTLKVIKRLFRFPYIVGAAGLGWGYLSGVLGKIQRVNNEQLIRYVRREQIATLLLRPSLWKGKSSE